MNNDLQAIIDSLVSTIDLSTIESNETLERGCISFWVPKEHKEKYEQIQGRTKSKFGKIFQEVLKSSIDKVKIS